MSRHQFQIQDTEIGIEDLNEELNDQFEQLHRAYLLNESFDWDDFKENSHDYFDQEFSDHSGYDSYFNNFTPLWNILLNQSLMKPAQELWQRSLEIAHEWEANNNDRIHKGTPFYFWGMAAILNDEIEKGFLLMHNALEEDRETHNTANPDLPSRHFVLLNPDPQAQAFHDKVDQMGDFLEEYLEDYRNQRSGALTFSEFRTHFLEETGLQETAFSFVYNLFRLEMLVNRTQEIPQENTFGSLHQADIFFAVCRIIENVFGYHLQSAVGQGAGFGTYLDNFSSNYGLSLHSHNRLGDVNDDRGNDFEATVRELLQGRYSFSDGASPNPVEADLCLAYCFRNFGAHNITDYPVIYSNFEEIAQRLLNSLFYVIEALYP